MSEERRYYGFDALRGSMMMLGLVIHAAMFYIVDPPPTMPIMVDRNQSPVMDLLMHFVHAFRMPAFFLMSGFFASLLVDKRGLPEMLKNRVARVLAPLVAGLFTVVPVSVLLWMSFAVSVRFGTHDLIPNLENARILVRESQERLPELKTPGALHLWFLYFLCLFYLFVPLLEKVARAIKPKERPWAASAKTWPMFALLAFCTFLTLWPFHGARVHEGFLSFIPRPHAFLYYFQFFFLGYLLNATRALEKLRLADAKVYGAMGTVLLAASLKVSEVDQSLIPQDAAWHAMACAVNAACTWSWICFFVAAALKWFDRPSPWSLYVSQSSYWVFLVHLPLSCFAAWLLALADIHALFKFAFVLGFTTFFSFLSYHYVVQRSWISVFLNGKRFDLDWPWRSPKAPVPKARVPAGD